MKKFLILSVLAALVAVVHAADPVQCRVTITSQPAGASVIIDGQDRGITPLTVFDLSAGRHHLRYRLAGYTQRDRFFDTSEGPVLEKNEVLVEEKGILLIKTDPEGCNIAIDGVSVGQSPRLITHLAAKDTYNVRLRKAGYQDQTISVKFDGRRPLVREEKLVPASGTLDIMSEPAGAEVTVNGIVRGKTPIKVADVPRGRAIVKFRLDGFEEEVRDLAVNAGDMQTLPVVMKCLPGTMFLTSVPEGARFYVNDEARGKGPLTLSGLKPGEYSVRAELEGYGAATRIVKLENGASAREEFKMSNMMGVLEVRTTPPGATISIDGRVVGIAKSRDAGAETSDTFVIENILEGEHRLLVTKDGYAETLRHVKIQSNKTSQHRVALRRLFIPDVELETARGTYTGILVSNGPDAVVIEVKLGITQSFSRDEIRNVKFLNDK